MTVITLLTDYGITDSYVAEVKGAILKINPNVTIVDISHDVGNYDIASGAFHMARSVPYFPYGTIHVGVVDPGVGSSRRSIIIQTKNAWFVGPDNGLLAPAAERLGIEKLWEITKMQLLPEKISKVFDGRDVFGPTAALLSKGICPDEIGSLVDDYIRLEIYEPKIIGNSIEATIIHSDNFGNLVTNVTYDTLEKMRLKEDSRIKVRVLEDEYELPYVERFSSVPIGELLLLVAGGGYLEISVNQGNAKKKLRLKIGEKLFLDF
jgi:S-adenosylmethionine hydrolase